MRAQHLIPDQMVYHPPRSTRIAIVVLLVGVGLGCDDEAIVRGLEAQDMSIIEDDSIYTPEVFDRSVPREIGMERGDFGDACVENTDCISGYCIDFEGSRVCTDLCFSDADCELGLTCGVLTNTGADITQLC